MSLINKMLQDLDARGGDGARGDASSVVRPVSYGARRGISPAALGAGLVALAVLGGGGFFAYQNFRSNAQPDAAPAAAPAAQANGAQRPVSEEAARKRDERIAAARHAAEAQAAASPLNPGGSAAPLAATPPPSQRAAAVKHRTGLAEESKPPARKPLAEQNAPKLAAAKQEKAAANTPPGRTSPARAALPATGAIGSAVETGLSSQQKAENEYRRALASLQDARVNEAIAGLEHAVYLYPRHDAARQTLVSLLIEAGRASDAIRHLTFATSLDPRQASMAMLLARLQLEHGGNALETLQRSLPYAESNADYRALLAGVLQRQNRHKEAAEQYQAAIRLQPGNAVWWMGMGISLQAEQRNAEAKVAFLRARDSGRLAPELQTFVERRLQQLN